MARSERLLTLLQTLRRYRRPVSGATLAEETGVSLRTLYRDIASLQTQGADIEGEPGIGYVLKPGFMLPPMMFSQDEIEALVLGSRWVARATDSRLAAAGADALAKIAAVLPADMREAVDQAAVVVGYAAHRQRTRPIFPLMRKAIRSERMVQLTYGDVNGAISTRRIWPFALGYFDNARIIMAWCELRQDFRHFRADRIVDFAVLEARYPRRRIALAREWHAREGMLHD